MTWQADKQTFAWTVHRPCNFQISWCLSDVSHIHIQSATHDQVEILKTPCVCSCTSCTGIFRATVFQTCISRSGWRLRRIPALVSPFFPELPCTIFNPGPLSVISSELLDIGKTFNLLSRTSLLSPAFTRIREEIFWMWSTLSPILRWSSTVFSPFLPLFWSRSCSKKCAYCIFSGLILFCSSLFLFLCVVESIREVASSILSLAPWLWVWMCT